MRKYGKKNPLFPAGRLLCGQHLMFMLRAERDAGILRISRSAAIRSKIRLRSSSFQTCMKSSFSEKITPEPVCGGGTERAARPDRYYGRSSSIIPHRFPQFSPYMETSSRNTARRPRRLFFITGNHDRYHPQAVKEAFAKNGVTVLDGKVTSLTMSAGLCIGGIDDPDIDPDSISGIDFNGREFCLLLATVPALLKIMPGQARTFVLAGHTHGRIRLSRGRKPFFMRTAAFSPIIRRSLYQKTALRWLTAWGLDLR